ncbi:MAG TPA: ThuA domain-containing protein [Candidatus Binatia bacterium]|nr:ThuA domain-containing protein [Candidatus Binatia bacterium]
MPARRVLVVAAVVGLLAGIAPPVTPAAASPPDHSSKPAFRVLVFHRGAPAALRNAGVSALRQLGKELNFAVEATDDPGRFVSHQLSRFRAVVFMNTTGDVLNDAQQAAFEDYYHLGGGFVAIGSAIEAEPDWPFLDDLLAARASEKLDVQPGTVKVYDRVHEATRDLPEYWLRTDSWYNLRSNPRGAVHVLASVVEARFALQPWGESLEAIEGGTMGFDHPVSWCRDWQGGRSFVVTGGHTPTAFTDAAFRSHLGGAIRWAAGVADPVFSDCGATVWANYQQTKIASPPNIGEPIGFDVLPDGRILQTTRLGEVRLHDPVSGTTQVLATLPVYTHSEDGLYGPAIDNDFETNHWVYLYYAPATVVINGQEFTTPVGAAPSQPAPDPALWTDCPNPQGQCWLGYFQLSRFRFVDGPTPYLDLASEQKILQVPVNRGACCHVGGDIDFDADNNLWLVTGDDTPAGGGNSGGFGPFNDQLTNESQTVAVSGATGGSFTLTLDGHTTGPIAVPINNAALEAALEALANVDDVAVSGTTTRTIQFRGSWSERDVPQMTADPSGLIGSSPIVTVTTSQQGGWYYPPFVDARRSALNTNDLRGKILRIHVEEDGSYTIPAGNLFPPGTPGTRPEIYAMGLRNPFRIQVDSEGNAYVADYSPDSRVPQNFRGPAGTGRVIVVREPANYGWPLCYGPDLPYYRWNFNTSQPLDDPAVPHECDNPNRGPANTSRWNTGLPYSPPVSKPDVWYSFNDNNEPNPLGTPCLAYYNGSGATTCPQLFPELGPGGGVGPHSATTYEYSPDNPNPTKFPPYFDGAVFFGEFTRDYLREIRLDSHGRVFKINDLLSCAAIGAQSPSRPFECDNPMDFQFGPDGTFYLLTYGDGFFQANPDAGMYRFEYVKGQRAPVAVLSAAPTSGPTPLTVAFSSAGSHDPDPSDSIRFEWDFQNDGVVDSIEPNPTFTYTTRGQYTARLTVIDSSGKTASTSTIITVGNTAPTVTIVTPPEGGLFAFGESIPYSVTVTDPEDGTVDCGRVETTFVLGHDDHGHGEANALGCSGTLPTNADDVSHGGNVFGVISVTYTDLGGPGGVPALTTIKQTTIRQKRNEVEFVLEQSGTNVATTADPLGGGQQRGSLGNGDWIRLNGPFNLVNINAIAFRVSSATASGSPTGQVEVRLDSVDGPVLTTVTILGTGSNTTYATQTFPITDPGGLHHIYLVFRPVTGGPTNNFFNLNWVEFVGPGVGVSP